MSANAVLVLSNPGGEGSLVIGAAGVAHGGLLELVGEVLGSVEDHSLLLAQLGHHGLLAGVSERVILPQLVCSLGEGLHDAGVCGTESEDDDITLGQNSVGLSDSFNLLGGGSNLAPHVLGDPGSFSGPVIVRGELTILEDLESWISSHLKPATSVLAGLSTVHLDEVDWRIIPEKISGGLLKLWLETLAVTTPSNDSGCLSGLSGYSHHSPGSVEHHQGGVDVSQLRVEVCVSEFEDVIC